MRLLTQREHSRTELQHKLRKRFSGSNHVGPALDSLQEQGYLSDERFVEEYLKSRMRKGYGPLRIKVELQERGIDQELISKYLAEQDAEWWRLIQQVASAKAGDISGYDQGTQQKVARFLEYRGFPVSMIRRYLWDDM